MVLTTLRNSTHMKSSIAPSTIHWWIASPKVISKTNRITSIQALHPVCTNVKDILELPLPLAFVFPLPLPPAQSGAMTFQERPLCSQFVAGVVIMNCCNIAELASAIPTCVEANWCSDKNAHRRRRSSNSTRSCSR